MKSRELMRFESRRAPHSRGERVADRKQLRDFTVQILLQIIHRHAPGRQNQRFDTR